MNTFITLKNDQLETVIGLLKDVPLKGKEARHRIRFIKQVIDRHTELTEAMNQLKEDFAKKDEQGSPMIITEADGTVRYDIDNNDLGRLSKEVSNLNSERSGNIEVLDPKVLYGIIENLDIEMTFSKEGIVYDEILTQLEEVMDENNHGGHVETLDYDPDEIEDAIFRE